MGKIPKVAILGGGTGSYVVASGLSKFPIHISMLMNMSDEGGSNRIVRDEFGLLPTSGIRQGIVALSKNRTVLRKLFTYRFPKGGEGLEGMTFGNLFMVAMADIMGSQKKGIKETCRLLQVRGDIIPISYDDIRLVAKYKDGTQVVGEHEIDVHKGKSRIVDLKTYPEAQLNPEAEKAIVDADLIIAGPGDLYTNTIANLVVKDIRLTLEKSRGKFLFITNLMNSPSETPGYRLSDFFEDLGKYLALERIDYVLVNNNKEFPKAALRAYEEEGTLPVEDNLTIKNISSGVKIVRTDLLSNQILEKVKGDKISRSMIRHDPKKIAREVVKIISEIKLNKDSV